MTSKNTEFRNAFLEIVDSLHVITHDPKQLERLDGPTVREALRRIGYIDADLTFQMNVRHKQGKKRGKKGRKRTKTKPKSQAQMRLPIRGLQMGD